SGMGTSRLLSTRLEQVFSEIERITQASVSDLKSLDLSQYDGINCSDFSSLKCFSKTEVKYEVCSFSKDVLPSISFVST
ncbi:hypothetical protein INP23_14725, partial [Staphylococcus aureus]|nr:hypothetical protein [Staphylococcus aureus]MBO8506499.1 hypothetical protein [Staphylococcus aureus]